MVPGCVQYTVSRHVSRISVIQSRRSKCYCNNSPWGTIHIGCQYFQFVGNIISWWSVTSKHIPHNTDSICSSFYFLLYVLFILLFYTIWFDHTWSIWPKHVVENKLWTYRVYVLCLSGLYWLEIFSFSLDWPQIFSFVLNENNN
jgi:hypothetical protein